jgi:hypothetical protein
MFTDNETQEEHAARTMTICPKCEQEKKVGLVVCWNCWGEFKHYRGHLKQWLAAKNI